MNLQNVTLSLPKDLVREVKVIAASRGTSISGLLSSMLADLVRQDDEYATARERSLARLHQGLNLGSKGKVAVERGELHER